MRPRAVVFEDELWIRELLWDVFDQRGYEVFKFPDPGLCPLHAAERCPCPGGTLCADVIISDLRMPNVNGLDFLEALRTKGCQKPRFAMTSGYWTDAEVERARQLGCKVFIKPFQLSEITQWLEEIEPLIVRDRQLLDWDGGEWFARKADQSEPG